MRVINLGQVTLKSHGEKGLGLLSEGISLRKARKKANQILHQESPSRCPVRHLFNSAIHPNCHLGFIVAMCMASAIAFAVC